MISRRQRRIQGGTRENAPPPPKKKEIHSIGSRHAVDSQGWILISELRSAQICRYLNLFFSWVKKLVQPDRVTYNLLQGDSLRL